jgi:ABC-type transport system involved in cytochrome bd biosynthesis fused ATPase/permease subunit
VRARFWREDRRAFRRWSYATALAWLAAGLWLALLVVLGDAVSRVFVGGQTRDGIAPAVALMVALAGARAALLWTSEVVAQGGASPPT